MNRDRRGDTAHGELAAANDLKGVIDTADFNDADKLGRGKEMQDRLSNLVAIFEDPGLDFSRNRAEGDDLLGDAYEYLMRHFATESGKSKGQFYTPAEVSRIMARVIGIRAATSADTTIYDPTCGSGSLLLKAADEAAELSGTKITIYGQEKDNATRALARMNMILHDHPAAEIWQGNTLADPHYKEKDGRLKAFDYVVANPPFSDKAWRNGFDPENDLYSRFEDGVPPQKNGDYAFLQHLLRSMKSNAKGAIILPHGVLFRGNVEGDIRRNLLRKGYIQGIIGLPANLFYGTGIPACIIVLDKENAAARSANGGGIFMINASQGFEKDGNKNRLRHQDIQKIVDVWNGQLEIPKYSRMVPLAEISDPKNDYNLNIPRYIDNAAEEDLQDIAAHLLGGIPFRDILGLQAYWDVFPNLGGALFEKIRPDYAEIKVPAAEIKGTIFTHPEFTAYQEGIHARFADWQTRSRPALIGLEVGASPKDLIAALAADLLETFAPARLIDRYDVYQRLMSYWTDVMQDDVYMIVDEGWGVAGRLRLITANGKGTEKADLTIGKLKYKADLIPPSLIVARYFAAEQNEITALQAEAEYLSGQMDELKKEHSAEDGLLAEVVNDKGNITKGAMTARLKEIGGDLDADDERQVLEAYRKLMDDLARVNKAVKAAQKALDEKVTAQYQQLTEEEIKTLVVDDKWLATLAAAVQGELERVSQALSGRIIELAERYAAPLPQLAQDVDDLANKVDAHLEKMGFAWQ